MEDNLIQHESLEIILVNCVFLQHSYTIGIYFLNIT